MSRSRSQAFLDMSIEIMLEAVGHYNQPHAKQKLPIFFELANNAWELLLTAKVIKDNNNDIKSVTAYDQHKKRADGQKYKKPPPLTFPSGAHKKISWSELLNKVNLDETLKKQLKLVHESRNAFVHYMGAPTNHNEWFQLAPSTVSSFRTQVSEWFDRDIDKDLHIVPIGLNLSRTTDTSIHSKDAKLLLAAMMNTHSNSLPDGKHSILTKISIKVVRSDAQRPADITAKISRDSDQADVVIVKEDPQEALKRTHPWEYKDLVEHLNEKYPLFKCNSEFHAAKKELTKNETYVKPWNLNPFNIEKSVKKMFYSKEIASKIAKKLNLTRKKT